MPLPVLRGIIDRRILVNYRVRPDALARLVPAPFRPQVVNGWGIAGICLIRFRQLRPRFLPAWCGMTSENAAHRVAVEWDRNGETRQGVYVPRRETSSRFAAWAGGRLFPGRLHHARFDAREEPGRYRLTVRDSEVAPLVDLDATVTDAIPADSIFGTLGDVSEFFRRGSLGYSDAGTTGCYDGIELRTDTWQIVPLAIHTLASRYFDDRTRFPAESIAFDNALLMTNIAHEWHARPAIQCAEC